MYTLALAMLLAQDQPHGFTVKPGFSVKQGFHIAKGDLPPAKEPEYVDPKISYMLASTQKAWVDTLPRVTDDPRLYEILARPLIVYNHEVLPRVSQSYNEAWNGEYNRSATKHPVGVTTRDPQWRTTAGFPEDVRVVNFLSLPDKGDIHVWRAHRDASANHGGRSGDSGTLVFSQFPVGTVFIEAGYQTINGHDICFELRTRTKISDGYGVDNWRPNRYVPCRTPVELDVAVEKATGEPSRISEALTANKYRKERFAFTFPRFESTAMRREAYQVSLPKLEPTVVARVLKTQPFRSTLDKNWQEFDDGTCAAPTTEHDEQIYPKGYNAAFFPTSGKSCRNCHEDNGKDASDLGPGDWYGVTQTYDSVLSWTPIKPIYGGMPETPQIDPRISGSPRVKLFAPRKP